MLFTSVLQISPALAVCARMVFVEICGSDRMDRGSMSTADGSGEPPVALR